ncbi:YfcE family phosphodiesterase [Desulfogranum mediterraneum]|uniref:YfcE family phosphodiesterase n=1 Tax=Desulfogranum mediterraneum TaxID=160661 RepID=UPI000412F2E9|nr:YfcE family phosphodiesterase [Desulfogranum mediterraneum]
MLIAILSDSHDQIVHLRRAVQLANQAGAGCLIHCGDLISPFMLGHLQAFQGPIHLISGNNQGDLQLIKTRCAASAGTFTHHGTQGCCRLDGLRIGFHHYPEKAHALARSGEFDLVCCGHDHIAAVQEIGDCLVVNPGDLLGKDAAPGFILFDSLDFSVRRLTVGRPMDFEEEFASSTTYLHTTHTPGSNLVNL